MCVYVYNNNIYICVCVCIYLCYPSIYNPKIFHLVILVRKCDAIETSAWYSDTIIRIGFRKKCDASFIYLFDCGRKGG